MDFQAKLHHCPACDSTSFKQKEGRTVCANCERPVSIKDTEPFKLLQESFIKMMTESKDD